MERSNVELKKGLRNPLEEAQVRKAVVALQAFLEKQRGAEKKKHELIGATEYISCIITRKTIPAKASLKPLTIDVPHSLYGAENDAELCLFVKDTDKDRIKQALAEDPVAGLAKVMSVKKLRKNFKQFEDRRTLAGAYDLFLADDRILPYLKTPLGTKFFVKKKQPSAVRVSRKDVSNSIRAVFQRTAMHVSAGACTNVKIAHFGLSVDEIVENIVVGMNNCATHIPKGWLGIQSISLKTNESIALPIYNALADMAKLPPVASKKAQLKRKLEEVEAKKPTATEEVEEAPVAKKQKAEKKAVPVKAEKKVTPVKAEKKAAPVKATEKKAAEKKAAPVKAEKKVTPVKATEKKATPGKVTEKKVTPVKAKTSEPKAKSSTPPATKKTKKPTPTKK